MVTLFLSAICLALTLGACTSLLYFQWRTGVPPRPSTKQERRAVMELLQQAGLSRNFRGKLHELGCGFGGLAQALAQAYPHAEIEAVEASPLVAAWAKFACRRWTNIRVQRLDFHDLDLGQAEVVVCYLMIGATARLAEKLEATLPAGALVVSVAFAIRGRPATLRKPLTGWQPGDVSLYRW